MQSPQAITSGGPSLGVKNKKEITLKSKYQGTRN